MLVKVLQLQARPGVSLEGSSSKIVNKCSLLNPGE